MAFASSTLFAAVSRSRIAISHPRKVASKNAWTTSRLSPSKSSSGAKSIWEYPNLAPFKPSRYWAWILFPEMRSKVGTSVVVYAWMASRSPFMRSVFFVALGLAITLTLLSPPGPVTRIRSSNETVSLCAPTTTFFSAALPLFAPREARQRGERRNMAATAFTRKSGLWCRVGIKIFCSTDPTVTPFALALSRTRCSSWPTGQMGRNFKSMPFFSYRLLVMALATPANWGDM